MLCQAFSDVLLDVQDPDVNDGDDPYLCGSYVKDIYKYLRDLEVGRGRSELYGVSADTVNPSLEVWLRASLSPTDFPEVLISDPAT